MRFLALAASHLRRNRVRAASTVAAMGLCVFLFCTLQSALARYDRVIESRSPRRLVTRNAITFMIPMPVAHGDAIRKVPGVRGVAKMNPFGGILPGRRDAGDREGHTDWSNAFQNLAVDAEPYLDMNPELLLPADQRKDFLADIRGCVMGRSLAARFGWTIGDRFHLESFSASYRKRSGPFEFVIRGLFEADPRFPGAETELMLFHYRYLDEGLGRRIRPTTFLVEIDDPERSAEIAAAIDALFEDSGDQTITETERAFASDFMSMAGDLGVLVNGIGLAVCFTILLVTANTMSMAARERRTEIAVLKTIGFTSGQVMGLVLAEALLIGLLGGGLGVGAAQAVLWAVNSQARGTWFGFAGMELRPAVALFSLGVALGLGLAAGFVPAWGAYRARVTDMLRGV